MVAPVNHLNVGNSNYTPIGCPPRNKARLFRPMQQLAVHPDVIVRRVRLRTQFGHHLTVHPYAPFCDQRLRLASRYHPRRSDDLLQPLQLAVATDELNPQKSRILLSLALLKGDKPAQIQELFRTY